MLEIVIDGTDGAGKTLCVSALKEHLQNLGFSVGTLAPYREKEVYHLWANEPASL